MFHEMKDLRGGLKQGMAAATRIGIQKILFYVDIARQYGAYKSFLSLLSGKSSGFRVLPAGYSGNIPPICCDPGRLELDVPGELHLTVSKQSQGGATRTVEGIREETVDAGC